MAAKFPRYFLTGKQVLSLAENLADRLDATPGDQKAGAGEKMRDASQNLCSIQDPLAAEVHQGRAAGRA